MLVWPARLAFTVAVVLALSSAHLAAFSLLGPYADWMTPALNYRLPGDIGGPMNIGEGYRWNVPVVTYAFDQSFLDYFGSNGVAAVERAIQMLNDLPPASSLILTNFVSNSGRFSFEAGVEGLFDLKSATLALLLEHLGLAPPTRNLYDLAWFDPTLLNPWIAIVPPVPDSVTMRNFDPNTLTPSQLVNGAFYFGVAYCWGPNANSLTNEYIYAERDDPYRPIETAVADWPTGDYYPTLGPGGWYTGLSQDDAGGLRYLLSTNNLAPELLLADVRGLSTNAGTYVNLALRPGVEKITFVRQDYDLLLGQAIPITIDYTDTYIASGIVMHQQLERIIVQPDFLFCAADTGEGNSWTPYYVRTATSNWWNSAGVSGGTNAGPGVIQPPVRITFNKLGPAVWTSEPNPQAATFPENPWWGSFDDSTNAPVTFPVGAAPRVGPMTVRFRLYSQDAGFDPRATASWQWFLTNCAQATLQVSSNLANWISCSVVTNQGAQVEWRYQANSFPQRFFRVVPQ